jgi:glycerate 2-kinase
MIIKNKDELATTVLRKIALEVIEAGIARVLPSVIMQSAVKFDNSRGILSINDNTYNIRKDRIFAIGGGKASGLMAKSLEDILGQENIANGIVSCNSNLFKTSKIQILRANHPIPDARGVNAVKKMLGLKIQHSIGKGDLIICLISGGGSALMPYPAPGINLKDKTKITELLLSSGADIKEINIVRKHISRVKGGRLGNFYSPATVISLILSDVIGNDLSSIASGPTSPDSSTFTDAFNVLKQYELLSKAPSSIMKTLQNGCLGLISETPKSLNNCHNYVIGDNNLAVQAMAQKATEMGFHPFIITSEQAGDTNEIALSRASEIIKSAKANYDVFILGGETTLRLPDSAGKGGRNQHYVASSLAAMKDCPVDWSMASVGTDGSDFLPGVAGAIIDSSSIHSMKKQNIDLQHYLDCCDSNTLLNKMGNSIIVTGNTETNVGDIMVYVLKR